MADWRGASRSNYFRVKDPVAFKKWASNLSLSVRMSDDQQRFGVAVGEDHTQSGIWPTYDTTAFGKEVDFPVELSRHLADGEIAVLLTAGNEAGESISGEAIAIDNTGKMVVLTLNDIYTLAARKFGVSIGDISRVES